MDSYERTTAFVRAFNFLDRNDLGMAGSRGTHLGWLLRGEQVNILFVDSVTDNEMRLVEMLGGPHGWTIYKMLLARREVSQDD